MDKTATIPTNEISLDLLKAGDRAEFARLVEETSGPIYRLGLRMLGTTQDAEDVLQNTFVKALTHIQEFEGRSSVLTWLYRIAANEALMQIRKQRPEVSIEDLQGEANGEEGETPTPLEFADWGNLPEDQLLSGEARRELDKAVLNLPANLRVVFLLRDIEGLSIEETAKALNLGEGNVKTRLLRARLRLRELLAGYYRERIKEK